MTRESKIICRNQFKSADEEARKAEFNRKLALLISREENRLQENEEKREPEAKEVEIKEPEERAGHARG